MEFKVKGIIGKEPESFVSKNGNPYVKISLSEKCRDGNTWHNITFFKDDAPMAESFKKGDLVVISGFMLKSNMKDEKYKDRFDMTGKTVELIKRYSDENKETSKGPF